MDIQDINKLAQNLNNAVSDSLRKNRIVQNKMDTKSSEIIAENDQLTKSGETKKAKNLLDTAMMAQSTNILSDPKEEAMKRFLIFNDPTKSIT